MKQLEQMGNVAFITIPVDALDLHDFLLKHGLHLVKGVGIKGERNRQIGVPQTGDALRHYSGITARIREIGRDRYGKYIKVTNYVLEHDQFQQLFFDFKCAK